MVRFPDPYLVDVKDTSLVSVEIPVFVPYQHNVAFSPVQEDKNGLKAPQVRCFPVEDKAFREYTERELNAKG